MPTQEWILRIAAVIVCLVVAVALLTGFGQVVVWMVSGVMGSQYESGDVIVGILMAVLIIVGVFAVDWFKGSVQK